MDTQSQRQKIGDYLKEHPGEWVNKARLRLVSGAEDVPTRTWELINLEHYNINSKKNQFNKLQDYQFVSSPIIKQPGVSHNLEYIFIGNRAIPKEEARQEALSL